MIVEKSNSCFSAVQFLSSLTEGVREYVTGKREDAIDERVTHYLRRKQLQRIASSSSTLRKTRRHTRTRNSWEEQERMHCEEKESKEGEIKDGIWGGEYETKVEKAIVTERPKRKGSKRRIKDI